MQPPRPRGGDPAAPQQRANFRLARWHLAAAFALALAVLAAFSGSRLARQSAAPHFVYQAMAFLQGRLDVHVELPSANDWARAPDGRFHVSFPPGPALLMTPGAALFGYQLNDVVFTLFFGALNAALALWLLQRLSARGDSERSFGENAVLATFFALGTVHLPCAVRGEVWFTAEVVGVTCSLLYLGAGHRLAHPLLAGAAFALGAITRAPLFFAGVYFLLELVAPGGRLDPGELRRELPARVRALALFLVPCIALGGFAAWMNLERFGSPFEFGHRFLHDNRVNVDVERWGLFDLHYLPRNLKAAFLLLPTVKSGWPPRLGFDPHGMSLLLTTPLFLLLFAPRRRSRLHRLLWPTVAAVALPALLYMNDGYVQFGYRFGLDWTPYLFVLLAAGGRPLGAPALLLGAAGIAVNAWGALAFR